MLLRSVQRLNLTYRDVDFDFREDCELLARWYNDPAIKRMTLRAVVLPGTGALRDL